MNILLLRIKRAAEHLNEEVIAAWATRNTIDESLSETPRNGCSSSLINDKLIYSKQSIKVAEKQGISHKTDLDCDR